MRCDDTLAFDGRKAQTNSLLDVLVCEKRSTMTPKPAIFTLVASLFPLVLAVQKCSLHHGGGICPDGNTCCPLKHIDGSACIPNDMGSYHATCCSDGLTGCAVNYTCEANQKCHATEGLTDPLVQVMPRYTLCRPTNIETLTTVHGFPIINEAKLAYYSSHGNILQLQQGSDGIKMALIVIHGAGRNADDYYCSATAAVRLQQQYPAESVLVIVPRFASVSDDAIHLHEGGIPLLWKDTGDGPWRYGAQAASPSKATTISSFETMDRIVSVLHNHTALPNLQHITIAGHSSGGQFVQRYSLLTSFWNSKRMSAIVANPSNYAYLTPLRFMNGTWKIPNTAKSDCPQYNEWEYGLDHGGKMVVPYKDRALERLNNNMTALIQRYAHRQVTYLAGGADRCNVSESQQHNGWCYSHGLETSCMDMMQGSSRWERNIRHVESLRMLGVKSHKRRVVPGVGHDHSLIFTSPTGLSALFPPIGEDAASVD